VFTSYPVETLSNSPALRRLQIATLIGDLSHSVEIFTADIEHEEMRSGVRDLSDPAYPVLARSLRVRRENIGATIVSPEPLTNGHRGRPKVPNRRARQGSRRKHVFPLLAAIAC
jgi:hypothetical protein